MEMRIVGLPVLLVTAHTRTQTVMSHIRDLSLVPVGKRHLGRSYTSTMAEHRRWSRRIWSEWIAKPQRPTLTDEVPA
jgi:hypothetical protein